MTKKLYTVTEFYGLDTAAQTPGTIWRVWATSEQDAIAVVCADIAAWWPYSTAADDIRVTGVEDESNKGTV